MVTVNLMKMVVKISMSKYAINFYLEVALMNKNVTNIIQNLMITSEFVNTINQTNASIMKNVCNIIQNYVRIFWEINVEKIKKIVNIYTSMCAKNTSLANVNLMINVNNII